MTLLTDELYFCLLMVQIILWVNFLLHFVQKKVLLCVFMCFLRLPLNTNFSSHFEQLKGFSFLCIPSCFLNSPWASNFLPQVEHSNCLWIRSCFLRSQENEKLLSHLAQLYGFSSKISAALEGFVASRLMEMLHFESPCCCWPPFCSSFGSTLW